MEIKLLSPIPCEHEDNQAKRIFSYKVVNKKGKEIPKIRACSNVSIHTESDIPKPIFGDPHRRTCYEYRLNDAFRENQRIVVRKWSVIRDSRSGKYIIDPYFARALQKDLPEDKEQDRKKEGNRQRGHRLANKDKGRS